MIEPEVKIASLEELYAATVTTSDRTASQTPRTIDALLWNRMQLAQGPANVWCRLNATACASQRVRLYRAGKSNKPVSKTKRKYLESGRAGAKAAEYASQESDITEVEKHPVLDMLNRPNPQQTGQQFAWQRYYHCEAAGNAFVVPTMGERSGAPAWLTLTQPEHTTPILSDEDFIAGWWYGRGGEDIKRFEADEVIQYYYWKTVNPYLGDSWIDDVSAAILVLKANYEHQRRFIDNGYLPPMIFRIKDGAVFTDEQIRQAEADIERKYQGVRKWTRPLFMRYFELQPTPTKPVDYQTLEQLDAFRRDIRNAAGVPESLADLNDANLASAKEGYDKQYLGATIAPRVHLMCQADTMMLLPLWGLEPGRYFFAADEIVPGDMEALVRKVSATADRIETINEARGELGREPLDGYDVLGAMTAQAAPAMDVEPEAKPEDEAAAQADQQVQVAEAFVLNGAQITAAVDIVAQVTGGTLPRDAGLGMLETLFNLKPEQAAKIMGSAGIATVATTPNPNPAAEAAQEAADAIAGNVPEGPDDEGKGERDRGTDGAVGDGAAGGSAGSDRAGDAERDEKGARDRAGVSAKEGGPAGSGDALGGGSGHNPHESPAVVGGEPLADHGGTPGERAARRLKGMTARYEPCCTHDEGVATKAAPDDAFQSALKQWYMLALNEAAVGTAGAKIRQDDIDGLARILNDFLPQYASIGADQAARAVDTGEAFDVVPQLPADYAPKLARELSASAEEALTTTIRTGIEEGQSIAQIQVEIEQAVPDISGFSAERVARTESARAMGVGKIYQWHAMGIKYKTWMLAAAGCPLCEAFAPRYGGKTPMLEPFVTAGTPISYVDEGGAPRVYRAFEDVLARPLHPHCRCDVLAVLEDEE